MNPTVLPVRNRTTLRDFLKLPSALYSTDSHWVPPLTSEVEKTLDVRRNPYFRRSQLERFVCYDADGPAGRIAVVLNPAHVERSHVKTAFFGFFEAKNRPAVVRALVAAAESFCHTYGAEFLEGPFNPNHYSELGLQVSGFDRPPAFFQTYNPSYYEDLLVSAGFNETARFHTRRNDHIASYVRDHLGAWKAPMKIQEYTVRCVNMKNLRNELERIREVCNDAFADNWHFLPLSREEYLFAAEYLHLVTRPELVIIVEHKGIPVGVLECVLDVNPLLRRFNGRSGPLKILRYLRARKHLKHLIIFAVGIKREYQKTRVFALLLNAACGFLEQYDTLETTWMSDSNILAVRAAEVLGLERDKEFAIFGKSVADGKRGGTP